MGTEVDWDWMSKKGARRETTIERRTTGRRDDGTAGRREKVPNLLIALREKDEYLMPDIKNNF